MAAHCVESAQVRSKRWPRWIWMTMRSEVAQDERGQDGDLAPRAVVRICGIYEAEISPWT